MSSAFLRPGRLADFPGVRTLGYRRAEGKLEQNDVFDLESFHGGSNVYVSARDLHRWNASFLEKLLFNDTILAAIYQPALIGRAPSGLTLGSWYRNAAATTFAYGGHLQGFQSEVIRHTTSRWSIVYVSNNTLEPWLQHRVVRSINAILDGQDQAALIAPVTDEIRTEDRQALAGRWLMPDGDTFTISFSDRLSISRNGVSYALFQVDPRTFYAPGLNHMIAFTKNKNGLPARINVSSLFDEKWGTRTGV